ncbi:MAG: DNA repair protein RadC [Elusimicrobia bacterium]|nr:DNA repair protein RadC [Elusimicrobiota bacterium]MDE2424437.1 DNA repair protein RadC [Elusimicrobiota bacterium]
MHKNYEITKGFGTDGQAGLDAKGSGRKRPMKIRVMIVREGRPAEAEISSPQAVFKFMKPKCRRLDREHFWRIDVDARSRVLGYEVVSVGTISASLVHPREVFKGAILNNAAAVIVAHNHPSGDTTPSAEDKEATRRIQRAGELLGIPLLDHMVLADGSFFSFKDHGLM